MQRISDRSRRAVPISSATELPYPARPIGCSIEDWSVWLMIWRFSSHDTLMIPTRYGAWSITPAER